MDHKAAGVREGEILAGKYRVERVLGIGGMGAVVAAQHLQLDTKVAIKVLLPAMLEHQVAVARFAREARNAVKITSEHVARILDVGTLDSGAPYMVMEYLEGADLSAYLRQKGPLPFEDAIDFVLQAMEAIAEAHALGIVHRDLKPANMFCIRSADGKLSIKVLDFGISKATMSGGTSANLSMTATAALVGSPFYMSPEQMDPTQMDPTQGADARTDIWALGVILFELLTGKVPFFGETVPEVSIRVATRPPPPLRSFRADAPEGLEAVILTCLEKDRQRRYRNVGELALALLPFTRQRAKASVEKITNIIQAAGLSTTALSVPPSPDAVRLPPRAETMTALGRTTSGTRGGKAAVAMFVGAGVLATAGGLAAIRPVLRWLHPAADAAPLIDPPQLSDTGARSTGDGAAAKLCGPEDTRCSETTPQTCTDGAWVSGPVTEGQCGAECTPAAFRSKCKGTTPQTCDAAGRWVDGSPCAKSQTCRDGACVDSPGPAPTTYPHPTTTPTTHPTTPPPPAPPPPPPPVSTSSAPAPPPTCVPPFTYDAQGRKHFKPQCFAQ